MVENKNDLISIVVPVYNVEKYLAECVESLLSQSYTNIEIILVDDGSTDNSLSLCYNYQKNDERIRTYAKNNEGLGLTRNYGISKATGKYICFVDSDDYLFSDAIESMYKVALESNADVISANTVYKEMPMDVCIQEGEYNSERIHHYLMNHIMGNYPGKKDAYTYTATAKLYKLETLKKHRIQFPSERKLIWEDLVFSTSLFPKCEKIYIMHKPVYYYRYNDSSLTHKYVPGKFEKIITLYKYMLKQLYLLHLSKETELRLNNNFLGHIRTCIKLEVFYASKNGKKHAISEIKKICNSDVVNSIIDSIPADTYNRSQKLYNICIKKRLVKCVYCLTWLQNRRKRID